MFLSSCGELELFMKEEKNKKILDSFYKHC